MFRLRVKEPEPDQRAAVNALLNAAREHNAAGEKPKAVACLDQAGDLIEKLIGAESPLAVHFALLSEVRCTAAVNQRELGRLNDALANFNRAMMAAERWGERAADPAQVLRRGAVAYEAGRTFVLAGNDGGAIDHLSQACEIYESLPLNDPLTEARLVDSYCYLGQAFARVGGRTSAVLFLQIAVEHLRRCPDAPTALGEYPPWRKSDRMADLLAAAADVFCAFDHLDLAVNCADSAIMICAQSGTFVGDTARYYRMATRVAGLVHRLAGRIDTADEAESLGARSLRPGDDNLPSLTAAAVASGRTFGPDVVDTVRRSLGRALVPPPSRVILSGLRSSESSDVLVSSDRVMTQGTSSEQAQALVRAALALADASRVEQLIDPMFSGRVATEAQSLFTVASGLDDVDQWADVMESWVQMLLGASEALQAKTSDGGEVQVWVHDLANLARNVFDRAAAAHPGADFLRPLGAEVYSHLIGVLSKRGNTAEALKVRKEGAAYLR